MIRRSKLEVFMDIMKVVAEEREMKRTKIMYRANLAWKVLDEALDVLERKGALTSRATRGGVVVAPTEAGLDLLHRFREVESIFADPSPSVGALLYPTETVALIQ